MQGIDKICDRIISDAKADSEAVIRQAELEAEAIKSKLAAESDEKAALILAEGTKAAGLRAALLRGSAEMETRKNLLAAKQELITAAFTKAIERLNSLPAPEKISLLAKLVSSASRTGAEELILSQKDLSDIGPAVLEAANAALAADGKTAGLRLSSVPRELSHGGFMLCDGDIEINGSFDAIVEGLKNELTGEIAVVLF